MNTETMTVHKALCELKTLDSRIQKAIGKSNYVFAKKHSSSKISGVDLGKHCDDIRSDFQSATDLIARRDAIKRAVVLSNARTMVKIDGKEYTVAEAIEMKNHGLSHHQRLLSKLTADLLEAQRAAQSCNGENLEKRADEYVKGLYANADMKNLSDEIKEMRENFITSQTIEVIDPINASEKIDKLRNFIDSFTVEIDSALSVSNALTEITIEY